MEDKKLDIRMLMPCESDKRPVAPLNYIQWIFNSIGYDGMLFRFINPNKHIKFEEFDGYLYIKYVNDYGRFNEFIRYDIYYDIIYIWKNEGTQISLVSELENYCKENNIKYLIEKPKKCTYGAE